MKNSNKFATNKGGVIKSLNDTRKDSPKSEVVKGSDLRDGKKINK